jgi:3-phenylpropionate/trans-cinnamate dioxygenase ferredoxin subunit
MSDFVKVGSTSAAPDPGKQYIELEDRFVVLFHVGGSFYCLDDVCTHDGGPLGEGQLQGWTIACPRHGARFDVRDGRAVSMPATEATTAHEVKVEGDDIYIKLSD